MRLGILTQYYPPEIGAPQARLSALARGFVRRGHQVTVITAKPNYPTGRVFPGYRGAVAREDRDGISVMRLPIYATQRAELPRRLMSYLSFVASSAIGGTLLAGRLDFLMVESPPLFLGLSGLWLRGVTRSRMIFNVSDLWPRAIVRMGAVRDGGAAHRMSEALEARCYRRAWLVTAQTSEIAADISRRFPAVHTYHLPNGVDCDVFAPDRATPAAREALGANGRCLALYAGLHGLGQGLDQVVDAAAALAPAGLLDFVLVGDGPARAALIESARARQIPNVRFHPARPHQEVPALLAAADMIVVPLSRALADAVPSKLYEAMASGRPVVLVAGGEAASIVSRHQAGIVVAPGDHAGLISALQTLAGDADLRRRLGANARVAADQFDRQRAVDRFAALLERELEAEGSNGHRRG